MGFLRKFGAFLVLVQLAALVPSQLASLAEVSRSALWVRFAPVWIALAAGFVVMVLFGLIVLSRKKRRTDG